MTLTLESTEGSPSTKQSDNKYFTTANCLIQIHILVFRFIILFSLDVWELSWGGEGWKVLNSLFIEADVIKCPSLYPIHIILPVVLFE